MYWFHEQLFVSIELAGIIDRSGHSCSTGVGTGEFMYVHSHEEWSLGKKSWIQSFIMLENILGCLGFLAEKQSVFFAYREKS